MLRAEAGNYDTYNTEGMVSGPLVDSLADHVVLRMAPPALYCKRLGLSADYLYE